MSQLSCLSARALHVGVSMWTCKLAGAFWVSVVRNRGTRLRCGNLGVLALFSISVCGAETRIGTGAHVSPTWRFMGS